MDEILEQPIKVYVKLNANKEVIEINSELFIKDLTGWIYVDSGYGDKYAHAQSHYLDRPLIDENGNYTYKYDNDIK